MIKRLISTIMVVVIVMTISAVGVSAEDTVMTLDDKAKVINQLDILRGDGVDFKLEDQLKRSEAAAFIVRLVGMDSEVTTNKAKYLQMNFTDVESHQWYASYVGYCSQVGIIDGFGDGTFKPDDNVSEQAFLKMVLTALGYDYNVDFVWSTVFASAYNLKVVSDVSYATRTEDNKNYKRGDVVTTLYNALAGKKKGTETYMLQYFIEKGLISESQAKESGLMTYNLETKVDSYEMLNNHLIQVTFSEPITNFSVENVNARNISDDIEVTVVNVLPAEYGDSYLVDLKNDVLPDRTYELDFLNIEDQGGNITDMFKLSIEVERTSAVESNYFMISDLAAVANDRVNVIFTHPVNDNALIASAYKIMKDGQLIRGGNSEDIAVGLMPGNNKGVSLTMKDYTFTEGDEYSVVIEGDVISQYGVNLNNGEGDYAKFTGVALASTTFGVAGVSSVTTKAFDIVFTSAVNEAMGSQIYNYYLTNAKGDVVSIDHASVNSDGRIVRVTTKDVMLVDGAYSVRIVNLEGASANEKIMDKAYTFDVINSTHTDVEITNVSSIDARTIAVTFNSALDAKDAINSDYYQIKGSGSYSVNPSAVYYDPSVNANTVELYLPTTKTMSVNGTYEVAVSASMRDESGEKQSSSVRRSFTNTKSKALNTYIEAAEVVGENTVRLTMNKEIALEVPNVLNTNYSLSYEVGETTVTKTPISANYIDAKTMIVKFVGLEKGVSYTMTFDELVDYSGVKTDNSQGTYSQEVEW